MSQPDQSILTARNRLIALFLVLCILDTVLVIIARDRWAIGRILLTLVVMYFVVQGRKWAKWLLIGICSFLVIILITMVVLLRSKLSIVLIVGSLIMAMLSAMTAIYMLRSQELARYFSWKRQSYSR
jgi:O-antigen ligase